MKIYKKILYLLIIVAQLSSFSFSLATSLVRATDEVSSSVIMESSDHLIKFFTPSLIPANGKIVITPESGRFDIPIDLDYKDVDIAVSSSESEEYIDREIRSSFDGISDVVQVVSGQDGSITIKLSPAFNINPGSNVKISIGKNAQFGEIGEHRIINPVDLGAYKVNIETFDNLDNQIDRSTTMIATTQKVRMSTYVEKLRSNGKPTKNDTLIAGTLITIMSLTTNYKAYCRYIGTKSADYEIASTTKFSEMTDSFTNSGDFYHSVFLMSLPPGMWHYYVRCIDRDGVQDADSYLIEFRMAAAGSGNTGEGEANIDNGTGSGGGSGNSTGGSSHSSGSGGGGGTGSGGGSGAGSGELQPYPAPLSAPDVVLKGWAYPKSKITILKDGKQEKIIDANEKAEFSLDINALNKGVYTFSVYADDSDNIRSDTYSTTAWINDGTKTTVSEIFVAPSIKLSNNSIGLGESLPVSGQTAPDANVEVFMYSAKNLNPTLEQMTKKEIKAGSNGRWSLDFDTKGLSLGSYKIKARANMALFGYSNFGKALDVGIGVSASDLSKYKKTDINKDGKVNLLDFSILLYHWGTDHDLADFNSDKKVNLIDFSMMMFDWTG